MDRSRLHISPYLCLLGLCIQGYSQVDLFYADVTITAQYNDHAHKGEGIEKLNDKRLESKYLTFHDSAWVQFAADRPLKLSSYAFTSGNDVPKRDPRNWTVRGSTDGTTWKTIDTKANQVFPDRLQRLEFPTSAADAYTFFRFEMKSSDTILQVTELELYGIPTDGAAIPLNLSKLAGGEAEFTDQWNDSPSSETVESLFDNNPSTKFLTPHPLTWVQYKCENPNLYIVNQYNIVSGGDAIYRDPKTWEFHGSIDGVTWITLDTRSNQFFASRLQEMRFKFANTNQYRYFRLKILSNNGEIFCQMSDLKLFGVKGAGIGTTIPIASFTSGKSFIEPGQAVDFTSTSQNATSFSWKFSGGTPETSTAQNPRVVFNGNGSHDVTLSVANSTGSDRTTSIGHVYVEKASSWIGFVPPTVVFTDSAKTLPGSAILRNAVPDVEKMMRDQALEACKQIYYGASSPINAFTKLNLILENNPNTLAYKFGSPPEITIVVGAQYIDKFYNSNGKNLGLVAKEIKGILTHEGTHGYQYFPKKCGSYTTGTDYYGFVEGMSDYSRTIVTQFTPPRSPKIGGSYNDGYTTTGFFLKWITEVKDPDFVIKMNQSARIFDKWSWDLAVKRILGPAYNISGLWNEYQVSLGAPSTASRAPFPLGTSRLSQNYPNPFAGSTSIQIDAAESGFLRVDVFDLHGKRVKNLASGKCEAGKLTLVWNGRNEAGKKVQAGLYFYKMDLNGLSEVRKLEIVD